MQRSRSIRNTILAVGVATTATVAFMPAAWSDDPFGGDHDPAVSQEQLNQIGLGLQALAEDPRAIVGLQQAFERGSVDDFRVELRDIGLEPPGDKCDPYVTVYVTALTSDWKIDEPQPLLEVQKFVRGVCPPGTYGLSSPH